MNSILPKPNFGSNSIFQQKWTGATISSVTTEPGLENRIDIRFFRNDFPILIIAICVCALFRVTVISRDVI